MASDRDLRAWRVAAFVLGSRMLDVRDPQSLISRGWEREAGLNPPPRRSGQFRYLTIIPREGLEPGDGQDSSAAQSIRRTR